MRRLVLAAACALAALLLAACFDWSSLSDQCGSAIGAAFVITGHQHTCARDSAGAVSCWGNNVAGQLGLGDTVERDTPTIVQMDGGTRAARIYVGRGDGQLTSGTAAFSCLQNTDGQMSCWGDNSSGQLGIGTTTQQTTPAGVVNLGPVTTACLGGKHTCALGTDGILSCWGSATEGQLGLGASAALVTAPAAIPASAFSGAPSSVVCGFDYTCALVANGTTARNDVYCWGDDAEGQLGVRADPTVPAGVPGAVQFADGGPNPVLVGTGAAHTCVLFDDQSLVCWGLNSSSQLGSGDTLSGPTPRSQPGAWADVDPGEVSTCARTVAGDLMCWGDNASGEVGVGTMGMAYDSPQDLDLTVTATWAGGHHVCAIVAGNVQCWGDNTFGQLGNGTRTTEDKPTAAVAGCP